jgi:hypothetical protein
MHLLFQSPQIFSCNFTQALGCQSFGDEFLVLTCHIQETHTHATGGDLVISAVDIGPRRSGASMVMSKISFSLRGFGQRIKALIELKFRVSPAISTLACCTMTGHLTSILELWRLSLLTGHLPVQG